jgi:DNA (cytosine-5)-methyltransferase 1
MTYKILDLFCGAGGATKGLQRAGFYVVGVDIKPQPHYCGEEFIQADAMTVALEGYDAYWASPVCKGGSIASLCRPGLQEKYPEQITGIRKRLESAGKPYILENVPGYRRILKNPFMLCGTMFGLKVRRHRYFETNFTMNFLLPSCGCKGKAGYTAASGGFSSWKNGAKLISVAGHNFAVADARLALGINWTGQEGLSQAIPPAYSEFIGKQLMKYLGIPVGDDLPAEEFKKDYAEIARAEIAEKRGGLTKNG